MLKREEYKNSPKRFHCFNCQGDYYCSFEKQQEHIKECLKDASLSQLFFLHDQEDNPDIKEALGWLMLFHHSANIN